MGYTFFQKNQKNIWIFERLHIASAADTAKILVFVFVLIFITWNCLKGSIAANQRFLIFFFFDLETEHEYFRRVSSY